MGDGLLAEFPAVGDAIRATRSIQVQMRDYAVRMRAGVHVGDITVSGNDVFGDAVNIAARLQSAAQPGNGLISRLAVDLAGGSLGADVTLKREGALRLKGIADAVDAFSLDLSGGRAAKKLAAYQRAQDIRFAASHDGVKLAWTAVGDGPPWSRPRTGSLILNLTGSLSTAVGWPNLPIGTVLCALINGATACLIGTCPRFRLIIS
ncbi:adenylate/guanylate cyclase domain-containing protein [Sulfitobacter aestuariivivens]|uniref:adenylate/guanylate cyclase domain-containing protein n=1 Tax=Sulfitobacter aestuariivivens TaxID=2766981 RepID=UPI00360FDA74